MKCLLQKLKSFSSTTKINFNNPVENILKIRKQTNSDASASLNIIRRNFHSQIKSQRKLNSIFNNRNRSSNKSFFLANNFYFCTNMKENKDINPDHKHDFQYDLFVIGGGSGGLAAAKEAAIFSNKIAVADYVTPSPQGTKWGLGGTCVNVGCIPKKLYHYSALKSEDLSIYEKLGIDISYEKVTKVKKIAIPKEDSSYMLGQKADKNNNSLGEQKKSDNVDNSGYVYEDREFNYPLIDWNILRSKIIRYTKKLNFSHRAKLRETKVTYYNKKAKLLDKNTISLIDDKGKEEIVTADKILISVGGRPAYGNFKGGKENCISSDDVFSLKNSPGKTLIIGAGYIALETAGFLNGLGYDTSVMVRNKILRGFDQDIANRIGDHLMDHGVRFIKNSNAYEFINKEGKILVKYKTDKDNEDSIINEEEFDTVLLAIGRNASTDVLNLDEVGVNIDKNTGKIIVDEYEKTSIDNIYSIGDCALNRPELTPPAIRVSNETLFNII